MIRLPVIPHDLDVDALTPAQLKVRRKARRVNRDERAGASITTRTWLPGEKALRASEDYNPEYYRPRKRSECETAPRPCPFVSCVHHLYLSVDAESGTIKFNFPDREPWQLDNTCALDVADAGEQTLERIGDLVNLTRERVRQIEMRALKRMGPWAAELSRKETT